MRTPENSTGQRTYKRREVKVVCWRLAKKIHHEFQVFCWRHRPGRLPIQREVECALVYWTLVPQPVQDAFRKRMMAE